MLMPLTAEDVVSGIFYFCKQHNKETLSADRETLHRAFFALKGKYPDVMTLFTFRDREQFPESTQLDQALSNLDASGMITRQNMEPRYYRVEATLVCSYDKFSKLLLERSGIGTDLIEKAASDIEKAVAA